jgi:protein-disulfide isomerase
MSAAKGKKAEDTVTRNIVIGTIVFVLIAVGGLIAYEKNQKGAVSQAIPSQVSADNGYAISFNTELTGVPVVDIYEDFQCPVCMQFEAVNMDYIDSLVTEKKATVRYHILSFIGEESVLAANASACANDEDKFLAFHNSLYANQPAAENSGEWSNERLIAIAKVAGISGKKFESCVNDGTYAGWVAKVAEAGSKSGVNSTPTVFVNGKEIDRNKDYFSAVNFKAAIEG